MTYSYVLTLNEMFVVDYAPMPVNVDIQRVHCRTFNSKLQGRHQDFGSGGGNIQQKITQR